MKILVRGIIPEYSDAIKRKLIDKFAKEEEGVSPDVIEAYIKRFKEIKKSPKILEKDIFKYSWKELEQTVDSNQPKRIRAGKINGGEPSGDANLVYHKDRLRVYVGKSKNACIKYGNGYSFCISARGEDNMYDSYRHHHEGTPYFVFDDTKSSSKKKDGSFEDPSHALVIFKYQRLRRNNKQYSVTDADNKGDDEYFDFYGIAQDYPRLSGLKNIFVHSEPPDEEKRKYIITKKYNEIIRGIVEKHTQGDYEHFDGLLVFNGIKSASSNIEYLMKPHAEAYQFTGEIKTKFDNENIKQTKIGDFDESYKEFVDMISIGDEKFDAQWQISYRQLDLDYKGYRNYLQDIHEAVLAYRREMNRLRLTGE
jgi:uncharacterized protein YhfF